MKSLQRLFLFKRRYNLFFWPCWAKWGGVSQMHERGSKPSLRGERGASKVPFSLGKKNTN